MKIDGILRDSIGEIRFMHRDDFGFVRRNPLKRFIEVIGMGDNVVQAHDPDALTTSFQRHCLIAQDIQTMVVERLGDDFGTVPMIVIAENRHHRSLGQLLQDLGARLGVISAFRPVMPKKRVGDEIAAKNGEIRLLSESESNGAFYLSLSGVGSKMQVAQEDDAKSVECFRQTSKADTYLVNDGSVGLNKEPIQRSGGA